MIPCTTKRTTVSRPIKVDQISFIISENLVRDWIREKIIDGIGPNGVKLPESFTLNHFIDDGDASLEVSFDVPVLEAK